MPLAPQVDEKSLLPRCTCPSTADQLVLFETSGSASSSACQWPAVETSACGRVGFWYRRSRSVFLGRRGIGPLIVCPDTSVLIWMLENLDAVEEGGFGIPTGPLIADTWEQPIEAIRDLLQLWFWRDVRFFVGQPHLEDSRKPLSESRRRSRESAVEEFSRDLLERGGLDIRFTNERDEYEVLPIEKAEILDPSCPAHLDGFAQRESGVARWPKGHADRRLVKAALEAGCHAFLTYDEDILGCSAALEVGGMTAFTPEQLLGHLDDAGELEPLAVRDTHGLLPDISAFGRFYSLVGPDR